MSSLSEQDNHNSHGPLSYAPRSFRETPDKRLAPSQETPSGMGQIPVPAGFDTRLESAVSEALRHPLDPEVIEEPTGLTRELRRMAIMSVAGRFAAAVAVSAVVALFFVVMIPAARQPDGLSSSAAGIIKSIKAALPEPRQQDARQQDDSVKPAASEFQSILASSPSTEPVTREQSEKLLEQFVQWRQKPTLNQAP
jgi:DNA-binding PucR family transcriptional regulator